METLWQNVLLAANWAEQWLMQPMDGVVARSFAVRDLTFSSVLLRLMLSTVLGGAIGLERGRKNRPAGFRTYMLVCMGATMTMILGQYTDVLALAQGQRADVTRIGAQVINGIGFLGAGTILVTEKQQVKGLTTAAGLWASACMGLALGAGFYECVLLAFLLIIATVLILPKIESFFIEKARNMDIYVEFSEMEGLHQMIDYLKKQDVQIYEVEIDRAEHTSEKRPSAVFSIRLGRKQTHTKMIERLARLDALHSIKEL